MGILESITSPADVRVLSPEQREELVAEIREFLIHKVAATGGHLGPNLGVVELTVALHTVFDSPHDPFIFDTSHQSYVHKMLTGRAGQFETLRQRGGLSGYTNPKESEHDWTESSHASASLSVADGLSKAFRINGDSNRNVVAVVGDGALTGGMCWEALNNIAADHDRNVVIVVNDNGRSYAPTIGGFAENLRELRMQPMYDKLMEQGKSTLKSMGWIGERTFEALHAFKDGVRNQLMPTEMFTDLGIKYVGPVDGHNLKSLEHALSYARDYRGPLIVHVVTEKGKGFAPAEADSAELMHSTGVIDPTTGEPVSSSTKQGWTDVFSEEIVKLAREDDSLVAIAAAMAGPTGLLPFAEEFPDRFFDVGIAEQHAVASAAGLAMGGKHPVVAIYSTFLNRAFDQLLMDVSLMHLPVTIVLDRSGITGPDGASHNGVWDMSLCGIIPGIGVAAPRDGEQLAELLAEATQTDGPTVVRFPKGSVPMPIPAVDTTRDGVDILFYEDPANAAEESEASANAAGAGANSAVASGAPCSVLIISVGACAGTALAAAPELVAEGLSVTVVDPRWVVPVAPSLIALADSHDLVVVIEDGIIHGGIGSLVGEALNAAEVDTPVRQLAVPQIFPEHASRDELLEEFGLTPQALKDSVLAWADNVIAEDAALVSATEESAIEADETEGN